MLTRGLRMMAHILFAMFAGSASRRQPIAPRRLSYVTGDYTKPAKLRTLLNLIRSNGNLRCRLSTGTFNSKEEEAEDSAEAED
ncbi:hypothetical protein L596_001696 [Steinernema carpocapsae]|uniref:Secreted protein n=1 Tax=Steinernema carpocapsae TaxID=34508 RepID=A0A4U8UM85_STECR|nr:hypothetical protein L596_001696 [Steinernema carpocapsae]